MDERSKEVGLAIHDSLGKKLIPNVAFNVFVIQEFVDLVLKKRLSHILTFDDVNDKEPDDSNLGSQG
jgi:hypothetical protein